MTKTAILLAAAGLAALLTGCASNAGEAPDASPSDAAVDPVGDWGKVDEATAPSLLLQRGGRLTGTDGCNRLMGSWTQDGDTIEFGQVAATRRFCPDLDDVWLSNLATATIDGTTMTVFDADGNEIGTLERNDDPPTNRPDSDG